MSEELKPCPFCGNSAATVYPRTCNKDTPYNPRDRAFPIVRCGDCGAETAGKDWKGKDTAIASWNRRAAPIVPQGWTEDQIADACIAAEIPDSKFESVMIALRAMPAASLRAMAEEAGQHESPRWHRIDELREMARQFTCHPVSRGISDCEEAGDLMSDAAAEIERLCRVRNCLAGRSKTRNARLQQLERQRDYLLAEMRQIDGDTGNAGHYASEAISAICAEEGATAAVRDFGEESAQSLRDLRTAALLALGLLWMTERQSDKVHRAYTTLRDALGGKEALREGIQAALNAGHEADHPPGADWWAGKKDTAGAKCSHCTDNECTLKCLTAPADGVETGDGGNHG